MQGVHSAVLFPNLLICNPARIAIAFNNFRSDSVLQNLLFPFGFNQLKRYEAQRSVVQVQRGSVGLHNRTMLRQRHLHLHPHILRILIFVSILILTAIPLASAQDKENDTTTQNRPEDSFSPATPSQGGNGTSSFCVAGYNDCSTIGRRDACCTLTQVCTFDDSGRVGCCEFGVKCVGEIPLKGSNSAGSRGGGAGFGDVIVWATVVTVLISVGGMFGSIATL